MTDLEIRSGEQNQKKKKKFIPNLFSYKWYLVGDLLYKLEQGILHIHVIFPTMNRQTFIKIILVVFGKGKKADNSSFVCVCKSYWSLTVSGCVLCSCLWSPPELRCILSSRPQTSWRELHAGRKRHEMVSSSLCVYVCVCIHTSVCCMTGRHSLTCDLRILMSADTLSSSPVSSSLSIAEHKHTHTQKQYLHTFSPS